MMKRFGLLLLLGSMGFALGQTTAATTAPVDTIQPGTTVDRTAGGATTRGAGTTNNPWSPAVVVPRYEVQNSKGETCILMQFTFKILIQFTTNSGEQSEMEVTYAQLGEAEATGNCTSDERTFLLNFTSHQDWQIRIDFEKYPGDHDMFMATQAIIQWKYEQPFFPDDIKKAGRSESVVLDYNKLDIRATAGKTFKCDSRSATNPPATLTLQNIMIQPYAQESQDKGDFGEVEECSQPQPTIPTPKPTSAPSISTGGIVGIVVGVLAAVVIVVGGTFYYRNRQRSGYSGL